MKQTPKKKGDFSRKIVIFCIVLSVIYTVWAMVTFNVTNMEASALTVGVYGFFGGELLFLCLKRILAKERADDVAKGIDGDATENDLTDSEEDSYNDY